MSEEPDLTEVLDAFQVRTVRSGREAEAPRPFRELLIGCGNRREKRIDPSRRFTWNSLTTLDHDPACGADIVHDLEVLPWPIEDDGYDEVHAYCVLEHLGRQGDAGSFFGQFGEIWRILKPGGMLFAMCPSRTSAWAWGDPSHTRLILPETLVFLSQAEYAAQVGVTPMTDFRGLWRGDFEVVLCYDNGDLFSFALQAHKPARTFAAGAGAGAHRVPDGAAGAEPEMHVFVPVDDYRGD